MSLIVDRIKCIEESDEVGSDDIYLIVFRGRTVAPFNSNLVTVGPGTAWSDFDTGEADGSNVTIAQTHADAVYAVMMVELDRGVFFSSWSGKDISGDAVVGAWKSQTDLVWKSIMLGFEFAHLPTSSDSARAAGFTGIRNVLLGLSSLYMNLPKGNDDVIDVKRVSITSSGQAQTIRFRSETQDATYDVTFKQV